MKKMWDEFERAGVELGAVHYGTLLKVLAGNGHGDFSPEVIPFKSIFFGDRLVQVHSVHFIALYTFSV